MKTNYKTTHYIHLKVNDVNYTKMVKPNHQTIESIIREVNHKIDDLENETDDQSRKICQMIDSAQERLNAGC